MRRQPKHKPSFFKIMLSGFVNNLRIPPAFVKHIDEKLLPKKIFIKNSIGIRLWTVELKKVGNELLFEEGWRSFAEDNFVKAGEFLVFRLIDDSMFSVKIYGKTCCEKEKPKQNEKEGNPQQDSAKYNHYKSKLRGKSTVLGGCVSGRGEEIKRKDAPDSLLLTSAFCQVDTRSSDEDVQPSGCEHEYITDEDVELQEYKQNCQDKHKYMVRRTSRKIGERVMSKRRELKSYEFKSKYPFFLLRLGQYYVRKGLMLVPSSFIQAHLPQKLTNMTILDQRGRTWPARYNCYGGDKGYIMKGWKEIVSGNKLREGYVCAFELVDQKNVKFKLSVLSRRLETKKMLG